MANTAQISIASLDPDTLGNDLIAFLQTKPQYSGYNFEGANWSVMIDVLKRYGFLRSFYTNMAFSETFLVSAQKRDNAVSRANELAYIPSSMSSSGTSANITIATNNLQSFTIPSGTRFSGRNSNATFVFTTSNVYFQTSSVGNYTFPNVAIYEGTYTSDVFNVDYSIPNQLFTLSNPSIDISSLSVKVIQDNGANSTIFQEATNLFGLTAQSAVYFLQATSNNQYQIYFGDDVLSYQPKNGSVVQANYRVTAGPAADGINAFTLIDNLGQFNGGIINSINITPQNISSGGANAESVASIKLNAPRNFQTQERGVTATDYKTLILNSFPSVGDCYAYGGGVTAEAVLFGYVLISAVTVAGNPLTQSLKNQILTFLSDKDTIHPFTQMVDANTLFVDVSSNVHVNFNLTTLEPDYYQTQTINAIAQFSNNHLQKFNTPLRYSQLGTDIDAVDTTAIISNETNLTIKRNIPLTLNVNNALLFTFANPITNVSSVQFISNGQVSSITDTINNTSNGTLYMITLNASNNIVNFSPIGKVVYANGNINIPLLNISGLADTNSAFYIYANPAGKDIYGGQNDIIKIDTIDGINVNVLSV